MSIDPSYSLILCVGPPTTYAKPSGYCLTAFPVVAPHALSWAYESGFFALGRAGGAIVVAMMLAFLVVALPALSFAYESGFFTLGRAGGALIVRMMPALQVVAPLALI